MWYEQRTHNPKVGRFESSGSHYIKGDNNVRNKGFSLRYTGIYCNI